MGSSEEMPALRSIESKIGDINSSLYNISDQLTGLDSELSRLSENVVTELSEDSTKTLIEEVIRDLATLRQKLDDLTQLVRIKGAKISASTDTINVSTFVQVILLALILWRVW